MTWDEYIETAKPGDRVRCTVITKEVYRHSQSFHCEIDFSEPMELLAQGKMPGQRAYEAWQAGFGGPGKPWSELGDNTKAGWDAIANAAGRPS